jgi:hypothetical protein
LGHDDIVLNNVAEFATSYPSIFKEYRINSVVINYQTAAVGGNNAGIFVMVQLRESESGWTGLNYSQVVESWTDKPQFVAGSPSRNHSFRIVLEQAERGWKDMAMATEVLARIGSGLFTHGYSGSTSGHIVAHFDVSLR